MNRKKSPWSDPDLNTETKIVDPAPIEPKDQNQTPTHEQTNAPGNPKKKVPTEPYPNRSKD